MHPAATSSESPTSSPNPTQPKPRKLIAFATAALVTAALAIPLPATAQAAGTYTVTNIFSDGSVPAANTDTHFINPWGITNGTLWISAQGTGLSYVIAVAPPATGASAFQVIVPAATGGTTATGSPTGAASTGAATGFLLPAPNSTKATFLFASLDGIITGWNSKLGTAGSTAQVVINNSAAGAVYTSMALVTNPTGTFLLAANFGKANAIEVYDSTFAVAKLTGAFTDPSLPAGYSPFSVHVIGTQVFVAYSQHATTGAELVAPGNGIVDIYDINGTFVSRAVTGNNLNAPWGVAIAPATFGIFANDLLIGNFGDGIINVYDPKTFAFLGQLADGTGKTIANASLWELFFGLTAPSATTVGNLNTLYIVAGLAGEKHGLLAAINSSPTATGTATFGLSASTSALTVAAGSSTTAVISAAPTNNFSGTVNILCTGLPVAATCLFSPAILTVGATAPTTTTVTFSTAKPTASLHRSPLRGAATAGITAALLLPFGALLSFRRRRSPNQPRSIHLLGLLGMALLITTGFISGCSSQSPIVLPSTPTGTSAVTIQATSGNVTQTTVINLTVQ
jgi:uncharacterized protein (TIGR03118 family)